MKKFIAILFILIGIGLISYIPLRDLYNEYERNKLIEMYEKNYPDEDNNDNDEDLDISESEEDISNFYEYLTDLQTIVKKNNNSNNQNGTSENDEDENKKKEDELKDVIGIISIDKINVKLPIKNYFNETEIKSSVGHLPGTANPGEVGNCIIAGHRARAKGRLFNRLDEVEAGDIISITYNSDNFKYEVYEVLIVEPTDVSVLNYKDDESILTLITCHPVKVLTQRLIVKAKLLP